MILTHLVCDSTDTESEPEVEPDGQSDVEETTETEDDIQYNWQNKSVVDRKPFFPSSGDSGVKLVPDDVHSPLEIFQALFDDEVLDHTVSETNKAKKSVEESNKVPYRSNVTSGEGGLCVRHHLWFACCTRCEEQLGNVITSGSYTWLSWTSMA
ncbi:hypothetical protein E2C01_039858 [Portunus trituberculatus]|uniref:PiggyBac transposable element-derived protein domain-containing protein n=1 Tax=Portunus trituberculatus TaxID=210409 RepID=A0A5B7FLT1_PORTR|nr:hypothetical protein [Portunus trituberculatus]